MSDKWKFPKHAVIVVVLCLWSYLVLRIGIFYGSADSDIRLGCATHALLRDIRDRAKAEDKRLGEDLDQFLRKVDRKNVSARSIFAYVHENPQLRRVSEKTDSSEGPVNPSTPVTVVPIDR
jgi:hypothetical protein